MAFCRSKSLTEMMLIAQLVENREIIRGEANLNGFAGGKYPPQAVTNAKATANQSTGDNKGNTSFPIRTITLIGTLTVLFARHHSQFLVMEAKRFP